MLLQAAWIVPGIGWLTRLSIIIWKFTIGKQKKIQERLDIASGENVQFHSSDEADAIINKFKT